MPTHKDARELIAWLVYCIALIFWIPATFLAWLAGVISGELSPSRTIKLALHAAWLLGALAFCLMEGIHVSQIIAGMA